MKTLNKKYIINASVEKVWQALIDPQLIDDWGAGSAEMSDQEGKEFKLWGGDIFGKNLKVIPKSQLIQEWMAGDWDAPSKVTFTLTEKNGKTTVEILHEDVPDKEAVEINNGWDEFYMKPLKEYVETIL